ncbi:extracellular solute-binding protein [Nakamurella sp.]|uniref:sugar ABC transporter substrate-binding protein n=1 Tax=Nakamurella sp. TaxID=1869182 RepID=UPI003784A8A9
MLKVGLTLAAVPLVISACSSGSSSSSTTSAAATSAASGAASGSAAATGGAAGGNSASTLVVWADNSANTAKAIQPLCEKWASENGVTCQMRLFNGPSDLQNALIQGNTSGDVPDVFEGPHDQIGRFQQNGILAPVDLGANTDKFTKPAVQGVTYNGSIMGVPWATENVALLTNKSLSPTCPATMDDAVATAKQLQAAGTSAAGLGIGLQISSTGDGYHWQPLFSADGGYAFKQNADGTFDPKDMGIGSAGSIAAATRLQQLATEGVIGPNVTFDNAKDAFNGGKMAFWITGPWAIPDAKAALGDNLMVCPVPNWAGSSNVSQPFIGVRAFFQPNNAKNPVLASTFLSDEVQTTEFMDAMYAVDPRTPAWIPTLETASADAIVKAFGDYGKNGIPMPNIPQMSNVFEDWGLAEFQVASGADPTTTMTNAANSINQRNASLN